MLGRLMFGPVRKRRSPIGAFSLPSERRCLSPSGLADEIAWRGHVATFLGAAVLASLLAATGLTYLCLRRADVLPFVADGGVFGCEVRTVSGRQPQETGR